MNSISDRLLHLIQQQGYSYGELAECTGIPKSALQRYATGQTQKIPTERIETLARALNVSAAELLGWEEIPLPPEAEPYQPTHRIPILGRISAGLPLYAEQHIEGWTHTDLNSGAEYFALRVSGDSMNALNINDGYLIIVRRQSIVENGEVAVVLVGEDEATVKRFYRSGDTVTLMPQSTNPAHLPQIYSLRDTRILVLGKVIKVEFTL